jgi:hypothetical protein
MATLLSQSTPIAKKDHPCDACHWLNEGGFPDGVTISEIKAYIRAKRDGFKIKKGQKYIKHVQIWCGDFSVFKARPEIDAICHKYELYEEP